MNVGPVAACRREGARALSALQFLTRLPLPDLGWEEGRLRYALAWFPLAGLVVGGLAGAVLWLAAGPLGLPAAFAAVLGISVAAWLSGALHEDGLADLADGTGTPGRAAEQALEIMRDSRIGAHGAVALILAFAARITLLAALSPLAAAGALALGAAIGRAAILPVAVFERPARPDGLARLIARPDGGHAFYPRDILALAATLALAVALAGIAGVLALALGASCALLVGRFARARLGGITGDVLGAAAVLAEIAAIAALVGLR